MVSPAEDGIISTTLDHLRDKILPRLRREGRRIISKPIVEDLINENLPPFLSARPLRNRRAIITKAMDKLLARWSDSAWILEED